MEIEQPSQSPKATGFSVQTKFCLGILLILGLFTSLLSFGLYRQLQDSLVSSVYEKSEIILAELEATRKYISSDAQTEDFVAGFSG